MADGLKLNLKEAILLKNAEGTWWEIKGKDNSGANFSWQSPVVLSVDLSFSSNPGDVSITIACEEAGGANRIDWGDGQTTIDPTSPLQQIYSHSYGVSTGVFDVRVTSSVPFAVSFFNSGPVCVSIKGYYGNNASTISSARSSNLISVTEYLPPSITDLTRAFTNSTILNDPALINWDTSNVTNMAEMFQNALAFNQDISGWDTSNVTNMQYVFNNCHAFNQDISGWDTSNVTNMQYMFNDTVAFNQDISGWDTSNVTTMRDMFSETVAFNQDISGWNTSNVTTMSSMFREAVAFNQDISGWDTSNVIFMSYMFRNAQAFNQDLSALDISNVTSLSNFLGESNMSTENYSRTLIGFANSHFAGRAQDNNFLGATAITYNNTTYTTGNQFNDAVSARNYLVNTAGWTITDGGQV